MGRRIAKATPKGETRFFSDGAALLGEAEATTSEPFVGIEVDATRQRFRTQLGDVRVVDGNALDGIRIERAPLRA